MQTIVDEVKSMDLDDRGRTLVALVLAAREGLSQPALMEMLAQLRVGRTSTSKAA